MKVFFVVRALNTKEVLEEKNMAESGRKEKLMKKAERLACWGARDQLWQCWDKLGYESKQCQELRDKYEVECPYTWVVHFDRKYKYEKFKAEYMTKGYEVIDKENEKK